MFRFFSPTSVWNAPLLPTAPIDPNSAAITGTLENYINTSLANHTGPWINTTSYSTPIYTVPANQPTVPVIISSDNTPLRAAMAAVPVPANAQPAAGTDEEMTIYQPSTDTLWEMWLMSQSLLPPHVRVGHGWWRWITGRWDLLLRGHGAHVHGRDEGQPGPRVHGRQPAAR